ncbi:MAG: HU family DNA-binding protein [Clostridia bacterium]|nr:HU family DNA-binding protein [Clostridia bacterium]
MNKTQLIAAVAEAASISKKDAETAVSAVITSITNSLAAGEKVQIAGFGTFEVRERGERVGRDPRTSAEITIPASKAPAFKAGRALKDSVNK